MRSDLTDAGRRATPNEGASGRFLLLLLLACWFTFIVSLPLWRSMGTLPEAGAAHFAALAALALGLNLVLFAMLPLGHRPRLIAACSLLAGAVLLHFMLRYGALISPQTVVNVLETDDSEVRELITSRLVFDLLAFGALPALGLLLLRPGRPKLSRALAARGVLATAGIGLSLAAVMAGQHDLAPLMRNHRSLRYQFAPGNLLVSVASALQSQRSAEAAEREPIDPGVRPRTETGRRRIVVMVLGETVRAANWGLAGYARQTTPGLAARDDVIAMVARSCGTDTATSVPCLFSDIGREDYDRQRIASRENVLHLLQRAGVQVGWRENQAGCKGVCEGVPTLWLRDPAVAARHPGCGPDGCHDEALLEGLEATLDAGSGDMLIVLHQMGNHGPAYWRRVPPGQTPYEPACADDDFSRCSSESIVNAYDNAVRYTDRLLTGLIERLSARKGEDVAMIYVSDHGESLGERGLYLHGLPLWMAPETQTRVPMVLWLGPSWRERIEMDDRCRQQIGAAPADHDQIFHTLVGLFGVGTRAYRQSLDLLAACRPDHALAALRR